LSRVAVLGGTGWVGRHACALFAEHGHDVLAVARNPGSAHRFFALDLAGAPAAVIEELLRSQRVDVVVNATDSTNTTDGWDRTEAEHARTNVAMVERLVAAVGALPWPARIVHMGTIHEYGPAPVGTAIAEAYPTSPVNAYARSKLAGSSAVLAAARSGAVDGVVLRLVNLCGPDPAPDSFPGKLIRLFRAAGAGPATVTVTDARRDFVDVRDVAHAIALAAEEPAARGQVINIGSAAPVEIRELVRMLAAEAGFGPGRLTLHNGQVASVGGEWTCADITLAERLLGWRPKIGLRESLRDMWLC
jgi:nucleoside-diphosphate-sugar epimerase